MNRRYFRMVIRLLSPLSLGSGLNSNTDRDVLLDSRGNPYIPATSIAGVIGEGFDISQKKRLYGCDNNEDYEKSHVIFYDALYCNDQNAIISVRDSVALENKVGIDGAKFDFEIVEPGVCFKAYIELDDCVSEEDESVLLDQLAKLDSGTARFGHKTTRGYGQVRIEGLKRRCFADVEEWLGFDMFDDSCWVASEEKYLSSAYPNTESIKLKLRLKGALSIRSYTTECPKNRGSVAPDYKYLSLQDETPVIPGTSWAGAFRERFAQLAGEERTNKLFGYADKKTGEMRKSRITFSESVFSEGDYEKRLITRNSIDRFSAATNAGALYSEQTIYGGRTELIINIPKDTDNSDKAVLYAVICDLDNGFMAIGGLTSVGRGVFEVTKLEIGGKDMTGYLKSYDFDYLIGGVQ